VREPEFIHVRTYRMSGHTAADPAAYRSAEEVEAHRADDPITRLRETLRLAGIDGETLAGLERAAAEEMRAVLDSARDAPFPALERAFADVQGVGDPRVDAY
jgi:pyruvate dehydrogenase E1 component alpha subunit